MKLYVVAIPIGNRGDLTPRAIEVLQKVDFVLAEDTRRAGLLLHELGIHKELISYFDHNERERTPQILERLKGGATAALISDGGTPLISDPGYRIVVACHAEKIPVTPVPGPSALVAALSVAGLPTDRFFFEGFLPPKGEKRLRRVEAILARDCTTVLYESTHKIERLLEEMVEREPERFIVVCRELTKTHEEILRGTVKELLLVAQRPGGLKGEMVVVVGAAL
jgi:16S rRNA (cytidine1402-2'-O)-methyltransferase